MSYGRCNPEGALGLFCIRREIRQTLCKGQYIDIDIENCHPVILYQICNKFKEQFENIEYIEKYVKNRNKYLNQVMEYYEVDRDSAKKLFIILLYYGSFTTWAEEYNINTIDKPEIPFIKKLRKELQEIGRIILENNKELAQEIKKNKENHNITIYNEIGGVVSYFLQEYECRILETIFKYCKSKNLIPGNNIAVLCADGIMIKIEFYYDKLLSEFNGLIKEKFGLDLKFTVKEMTQDYLSILDSHILTEELIIKRELPGYDIDIKIDTNKDFEIETLTKYFESDLEKLGEEKYIKYFQYTNSFNYFNTYHAEFYYSNTIYKIFKSEVVAYKSFETMFKDLFITQNKTKIRFVELYQESKKKQKYSTFYFKPNDKQITDKKNLFSGFFYSTDDNKTYDDELIKPFINHIYYICNEVDSVEKPISNYLLNWFAHIIQKPEVKTNVAIVLYSITEGIGKNRLSDIMNKLFKNYENKFKDTQSLTKKFNGDMLGKLFVVGDEINARAQEIANELKDIIVRPEEIIEFKNKDSFKVEDYKNYFFTTNNENVFKVSNTDRRFMFIECPEHKQNNEYYENLIKFEKDDVRLKHLFNFFMNRDIENYKTRNIVMTEYKKRLLLANIPAYIKFVKENYEYLTAKVYDYDTQKHITKEWTPKALYDESIEYAKNNRMVSTYTLHSFEIQFKKVFGIFNKKNNKNQSIYIFDETKTLEDIDKLITENFIG